MKSTKEPQLVRILVEWHGFNYGRGDDDPVFVKEGECMEFARITPASYIVHYGDGRVKKILPRFYYGSRIKRYRSPEDQKPRAKWREYYGSHDRCSRTMLVFQLQENL